MDSLIVEAAHTAWVSIGQSIVNGNTETDLTSTKDVFEEGDLFGDFEIKELKGTFLGLYSTLALFQFSKGGITSCQELVVTS